MCRATFWWSMEVGSAGRKAGLVELAELIESVTAQKNNSADFAGNAGSTPKNLSGFTRNDV